MLNISYFHFNPFSVNTWIVWDESGNTMIVDPGFSDDRERDALYGYIEEQGLKPEAIVLTHGHIDHVLGVTECCARYGIPAYMSPADAAVMDKHGEVAVRFGFAFDLEAFRTEPVTDGQVLHLAGTDWLAIATPGHSPGGTCYYSADNHLLFSGDTLFKDTIGRTDLPCCEYDDLIVSLMDKVMDLPGETDVLPGHGAPTTISDERTHNPFLIPFNEPEQEGIDWDADGIELNG